MLAAIGMLLFTAGCAAGPWHGPSRGRTSELPAPAVSPESRPASDASGQSKSAIDAEVDEVARTAGTVFGDTAPGDAIHGVPEWDLDVRSYETHDRVERFINLFSGSSRGHFQVQLSRGTRYEAMIRAKLRAAGMPEDLAYLALIESGYDPHAYSSAAAVGLWQFMSSTGKAVGLRVDWWIDERRDPVRATEGAIRYLRDLHQQFGSYYLAAAAYNGGPGRVSRGLSRFAEELEGYEGDDRFFALADQDYLRAETRNYVPKLIAAALVAKDPMRFGIVPDYLPAFEYDSILVPAGTGLGAVALASGASVVELKDLNPSILRGMAPPDASLWVHVPSGTGASASAAIDSIVDLLGYRGVKVAKAISGTTFAKKHGLSLKQLRWFNPAMKINGKGVLGANQTLRIPTAETLAYAQDVPDPAVERYGSSVTSTKSSSGSRVHVVRRGETLSGIAKQYKISVTRLKSLNGLKGSRINAGQRLKVR